MAEGAHPVLSDVRDGIATLTLNRPDKANCLSEAMMDALESALADAENNKDVRVIVLAARGKIFCAGHDLAEMRSHDDRAYFEKLFARCSRLMAGVREARKPMIAKVQGAAVAAGCQLVATCDLAWAAEHAKFGVNGINLGLFCSTPSVALSRAILPKRALELLMTGRLIAAPRAGELGLINGAVPADALDATVDEAARAIASKSAAGMMLGKDLFYRQLGLPVEEAYAMAGDCMADNMGFAETQKLIDDFLARG